MLPYVDTVMRVVLNRLSISTKSLSRLIQATANLFRKHQPSDSTPPVNNVVALIFEILSDGLRMKARISPSTLRSMLEVCNI
jgi:putative NIF3 family GTP cyclohydrolase 1 type 2